MSARAIYILTSFSVGGAQKALLNLLNSDLNADYPAHVIALVPNAQSVEALFKQAGISTEVLGLKQPRQALLKLWRLVSTWRTNPPYILHGWMHHGNLIATMLWWLSGKRSRLFWSMHHTPEADTAKRWQHRLILWLSRVYSPLPEHIVYVSARSLQRHTELGFAANHAVVVPNGVVVRDSALLPNRVNAREVWGVAPPAFVLGSLTRYVPEKDIPNLLAAAGLLKLAIPNLLFILAGEGMDENNAALQTLIVQHDLSTQVRLLGVQRDVSTLLACMDVATLSSRREAFPLFIAEAMAAAVPVVATDVGDIAECVGATGYIVERENAKALAAAWLQMYQLSPSARQALGMLAQQRVRGVYGMDEVIATYQQLYAKY